MSLYKLVCARRSTVLSLPLQLVFLGLNQPEMPEFILGGVHIRVNMFSVVKVIKLFFFVAIVS
jgi:hypothetical protein